ncbi:hypothetical protein [Flavobacterium franklandianum]|uniref:hypothetical protein n=1 Tax=Flavobacterium franklandianum TaxID=2594430 RepID=UPI001F31C4B7|nr:hypothetical protein [Flavobacterium franklandianum]
MSSFAQNANDRKKNFDSTIKWSKISDAGILVVCTKEALNGINPADGKEIWKEVNPKYLHQGIIETMNGGATMPPSIG